MGKETKPLPITKPLAVEVATIVAAKLEPGATYLACFDVAQWSFVKIAALRDELKDSHNINLVAVQAYFKNGKPGVKFLDPKSREEQ